jgi:hypothetical protein
VYPCELKTGRPYAFINSVGSDFDFLGDYAVLPFVFFFLHKTAAAPNDSSKFK